MALSSLSFTLAGTNGQGVVLTDFTLHIKKDVPEPPVTSTEDNVRWYYITNASTKAYCAGKVMYYDAELDLMRFGDKSFSPDRIWSFWEQDGKLAIKNFNGDYIGTAGAGTGGATQCGKSEEEAGWVSMRQYILLREAAEQDERRKWERARWQMFLALQMNPYVKQKPSTPALWVPFAWEKDAEAARAQDGDWQVSRNEQLELDRLLEDFITSKGHGKDR